MEEQEGATSPYGGGGGNRDGVDSRLGLSSQLMQPLLHDSRESKTERPRVAAHARGMQAYKPQGSDVALTIIEPLTAPEDDAYDTPFLFKEPDGLHTAPSSTASTTYKNVDAVERGKRHRAFSVGFDGQKSLGSSGSSSSTKRGLGVFATLTRTASQALGFQSHGQTIAKNASKNVLEPAEVQRRLAAAKDLLPKAWYAGRLFFHQPKDGDVAGDMVTLGRVLQAYLDDATSRIYVEYQPLAWYSAQSPWRWLSPSKQRPGGDDSGASSSRLELNVVVDYNRSVHVQFAPMGWSVSEPSRVEQWLYRTPRLLTALLWYKTFAHTMLLYLLGLMSCCATIYSFSAREDKFGTAAKEPLIASLVLACAVLCLHALQLGSIVIALLKGDTLSDIFSVGFRETRELALLPASLLTTGAVLCNVYILGRLKAYHFANGIGDAVSDPTGFVSALYASIGSYISSLILTIVDIWLFQSADSLRIGTDLGDLLFRCGIAFYRVRMPWAALTLFCLLRLVQDCAFTNWTTMVALALICYGILYVLVWPQYYNARRRAFIEKQGDESTLALYPCLIGTACLCSIVACIGIALGWSELSESFSHASLIGLLVLSCPFSCVPCGIIVQGLLMAAADDD